MGAMKWLKLAGLVVGTTIVNVIVLSPGLLGLRMGGDSAVETAFAATVLIMSLIVLLYGSYVLTKPTAIIPVQHIESHEDYAAALERYRDVKPLAKEIMLALDQVERIVRKKGALMEVLSQRFQPEELSYKKFITVIAEVEKLFYANCRSMLNKLGVFDASEFSALASGPLPSRFSSKLLHEKRELYASYMSAVSGYLDANESILLKLDKLLLEIARLNSTDYRDVENMACMKEIDALIKQTKYYQA